MRNVSEVKIALANIRGRGSDRQVHGDRERLQSGDDQGQHAAGRKMDAEEVGRAKIGDQRIRGDGDGGEDQQDGQNEDSVDEQAAQNERDAHEIVGDPVGRQEIGEIAQMLNLRRFLLVEPAVERK